MFEQKNNRQPIVIKEKEEIKEDSLELERIKKSGLEQRQVQLALRKLFESHPEVYVPDITELSGNEVLPLDELQKAGKKYVAFSFDANRKHQVAVWIKLGPPHEANVIDSLEKSDNNAFCNSKQGEERLRTLLGEKNCKIEQISSPYQFQSDEWSCGVHVLSHSLYQFKIAENSEKISRVKQK